MISIKQQENYLTLKQHGDDSRISPKEAQQLDNVVIQTVQLSSSAQAKRDALGNFISYSITISVRNK